MKPHPRLLASSAHLERLRDTPSLPLLDQASLRVAAEATRLINERALTFNPGLHNSLLDRAREMQRRIVTLLVRWMQTGVSEYRHAALEDVRTMGEWKYWSWNRWREENPDPNSAFDLSYGENSATLALAYDWLHSSLTPDERSLFLDIALRWSFRPFLAQVESRKAWWIGLPNSNWNSVCSGGAGMLALTMMEDIPEAAEVLRIAELSITPYFQSLESTGGGWIEGIGYWNYGHRYAFWFALSHEQATGQPHPLLELPGVRETLDFPLDFCPDGQPCSFSDVNVWKPLAFHYAAAERFGRFDIIETLDSMVSDTRPRDWPNEAEMLIFHPGSKAGPAVSHGPICKRYPKLDWVVLADRLPHPGFYLSIRGGSSDVPHGELDLLSFHCVAGGERFIHNISINGGEEYLDTTFSNRRYELYEAIPFSKNTLLINGVGIKNPSAVRTKTFQAGGWVACRLDATEAMHSSGSGDGLGNSVRLCVRLFLLIDGNAAIVLDHIQLDSPGRAESRLHTPFPVTLAESGAEILGKKAALTLAFASTVASTLQRAEDALTTPGPGSTMLRWCTKARDHANITLATLLVRGGEFAKVDVREDGGQFLLEAQYGANRRVIEIPADLSSVSLRRY